MLADIPSCKAALVRVDDKPDPGLEWVVEVVYSTLVDANCNRGIASAPQVA